VTAEIGFNKNSGSSGKSGKYLQIAISGVTAVTLA